MRDRSTILPSGRYKGYILEYLPDAVIDSLWQELDGDNAYTRAQSRIYSEEEKALLLLLIDEIGERWNHSAAAIILPAVEE